jgi:S-DNA-T family DNA segregation ATPase FtsK/SpoIIIE
MFTGLDAAGEPLALDLSEMLHVLVAGTTGTSRSMCVNAIIMSLLRTKRSEEVKLLLIDSKHVEMARFVDAPQLSCPVVTDRSHAAAMLGWVVAKHEERLERLPMAGVRSVAAYNTLGDAELWKRMRPMRDEAEQPGNVVERPDGSDDGDDHALGMHEEEGD